MPHALLEITNLRAFQKASNHALKNAQSEEERCKVHGIILAWTVQNHMNKQRDSKQSHNFMELLHDVHGRIFLKNAIHQDFISMLRNDVLGNFGAFTIWNTSSPKDHQQMQCVDVPIINDKVHNLGEEVTISHIVGNTARCTCDALPSLKAFKHFAETLFPRHKCVEICLFRCNPLTAFTEVDHHVDGRFLPYSKKSSKDRNLLPLSLWINFDNFLPLELWCLRHKRGPISKSVVCSVENTDVIALSHDMCHRTVNPAVLQNLPPRGHTKTICSNTEECCNHQTSHFTSPIQPMNRMKITFSTTKTDLPGCCNSKNKEIIPEREAAAVKRSAQVATAVRKKQCKLKRTQDVGSIAMSEPQFQHLLAQRSTSLQQTTPQARLLDPTLQDSKLPPLRAAAQQPIVHMMPSSQALPTTVAAARSTCTASDDDSLPDATYYI